ncbi:YIP1 family protein [bacterium]|nr:YIP1 family protein [bacterium]
MNAIIERIKAIVLKPKQTWEEIAAEQTTPQDLMKNYVFIFAALPAVATFLGRWIIGIQIPFAGVYHFSFGASLVASITNYVITVASIWILAKILFVLGTKFGSNGDEAACFKMAVYSYFPYLAAGVLLIIPSLSVLVYLAGLYGLYLMYVGLPIIMETPEEKTIPFMVVIVVAVILVSVIASSIIGVILGAFGPKLPPL